MLWKLLLADIIVIEGHGFDKPVLILLNDYFAFSTGSFLLIYFGGFYIYFGNGAINPLYPSLGGLDLRKGTSWLNILNFGYLIGF